MNLDALLLDEFLGPWMSQWIQNLAQDPSAFADVLAHTSMPPAALQPTGPASSSLAQDFSQAAQATGLSPRLLEAVAHQESGFNPAAQSSAGAMGVMQLMPGTAASLHVANPWNAQENILGGAEYLKTLLTQFHSVRLALAAYNAGPGAVQAYGGVPPYAETQRYVHAIESALASAPVSPPA